MSRASLIGLKKRLLHICPANCIVVLPKGMRQVNYIEKNGKCYHTEAESHLSFIDESSRHIVLLLDKLKELSHVTA